jgi:aerobic carbon-monoxide dehydrogenase medium subunit
MPDASPAWHAPESLDEALALRAQLGDEAMVVAGGTFAGILVRQKLVGPSAFLYLGRVPELRRLHAANAELRIGAMVPHRVMVESPEVGAGWPSLAATFAVVASPRIRNQATVGGVLCDADYASDPPAMLAALDAAVLLRGPAGDRVVAVADFITGHYQTLLSPDELLVEVRVPRARAQTRGTYLKFTSRSSEDRPCVGIAAVAAVDGNGLCGNLRVVVGAVSERPQFLPDVCRLASEQRLTRELAAQIGAAYAGQVPTISDIRGSARYRTRVLSVCVRRALEALAA